MFMNIILVWNYVQTHLTSLHIVLILVSLNLSSVIICGQCNYKFYLDNAKKLLN